MLWVLKRNRLNEHPKHMLKLIGKEIFRILRSKIFCLSKPVLTCIALIIVIYLEFNSLYMRNP